MIATYFSIQEPDLAVIHASPSIAFYRDGAMGGEIFSMADNYIDNINEKEKPTKCSRSYKFENLKKKIIFLKASHGK